MNTISQTRIIICLILMTAVTQAGLVLYTPAFVQISHELHISSDLVKTTIAAYLLGFGASQLFYGAISDRIGRKKLLLAGMAIFSAGCLWSIFVHDYTCLFISRIVQGVGAGAGVTLGRCILRDCFAGKQYIKAASYLSTGFALGFGITPIIGGFLLTYFSWHIEFVFLMLCGIGLLIFFAFFLPETHSPPPEKTAVSTYTLNLCRFYWQAGKNKNLLSYLLGGVMSYSVVTAYTTMTPFLFQKSLGYGSFFYGVLTFIIATAYYLGASLSRVLIARYDVNKIIRIGLLLIVVSGIIMWLALMLFNVFNIYVVIIPLWFATVGQTLIWSNCIASALQDFTHNSGVAASFFSCLQMLLTALISAIIAFPHEQNQIPLAITIVLLGVIAWLIFQLTVFRSKSEEV